MQNKSWYVASVWVALCMSCGFLLRLMSGIKIFWILGIILAVIGLAVIMAVDWRTI